jgi:hypothetical protein
MSVDVVCVENKKQLRDFIDISFLLHQRDANWVPTLHPCERFKDHRRIKFDKQ